MAEKKFLDFLDRFDGGGMGKSGGKFEGGGLLSMLGNLFADPYGSDDKARMASRDAFYNAQGDAVPAPTLLAPRAGNNAGGNTGVKTSLRPQARPAPGISDMPNTGMTAIPGYTTEDPRQRFASQLVEMIGPDAAESMMNSGMGEQAYQAFVANNYNMPNY